jgi:pimeloyl-ACP methyl ester carboxylesterase
MARAGSILLALVGVVAVGAAVVSVAYKRDLDRAMDRISHGSTMIDTASGQIEYAEQGTGYPLLSIHGAGGGYDQGLSNVADLIGEGYRVIAPSRFGYLRTPIPADTSPAAQADAHAALLDTLKIDKAIVVGISAGATSALELALRHPDKVSALLLIVPGSYSPTSPVNIEESRGSSAAFWLVNNGADFFWWVTEKVAPSMLIRFIGVPPELVAAAPPAEQKRVNDIVDSILPLSRRFPGINIDSTPNLHPLPLETIRIPTFVMSARDDQFNTAPAAEYAAAHIPNAKLVIYDTGGHLLVGHETEAQKLINDFLTSALSGEKEAGAVVGQDTTRQ